jgi:murein DD-endopeptidase MepM/ murein hydrolase activator NlpD
MVQDADYFSQLLQEVMALFGARPPQRAPRQPTRPRSSGNVITSPGGYTAPVHSSWQSSGGFTYQPNATHPHGHQGVDMRAPGGTAIYPLARGIVTNVGTDPMGGNVVNVQHANGIRTYYAHLGTATCHKGDKVDINTVLGTIGNTGNASHTIPHLHFQVWKDGQIQDPAKFFSVPRYTDLSPQERAQGGWLSPEAKQEAQAFNMKNYVAARRVAFSNDVAKLLKVASQYEQIMQKLSEA